MHVLGGRFKCGVATHIFNLAHGLRESVDVVLALLYEGKVAEEAQAREIRTVVFNRRFPGDPHLILKLARFIKRERIDIIHTHTLNGNLYGRFAAFFSKLRFFSGCKIVTTVHTYMKEVISDQYKYKLMQKAVLLQNALTSKYVDKFIATSNGIKGSLLKDRISGEKISVIYNGIDLKPFNRLDDNTRIDIIRNNLGIKRDEQVIGTIGRLVPLKGHRSLLFAARELSKKFHNIKLVIVGDGPLSSDLKHLAMELKVDGLVVFTGFRSDILDVLRLIDIFILPSLFESCPYALLEAMAMGKPVVARLVGSLPEIIEHKKTGILAGSKDDRELIDAIAYLLDNPHLASEIGKNARKRIKDGFSLDRMCAMTKDVYFRVLSQ